MTRKRSTLSKTMLQGIVQTAMVGSEGSLERTYPGSVREEAARYFRFIADQLMPTKPETWFVNLWTKTVGGVVLHHFSRPYATEVLAARGSAIAPDAGWTFHSTLPMSSSVKED
jgi:hypothetical protein